MSNEIFNIFFIIFYDILHCFSKGDEQRAVFDTGESCGGRTMETFSRVYALLRIDAECCLHPVKTEHCLSQENDAFYARSKQADQVER